jgi:hypothetical protein
LAFHTQSMTDALGLGWVVHGRIFTRHGSSQTTEAIGRILGFASALPLELWVPGSHLVPRKKKAMPANLTR